MWGIVPAAGHGTRIQPLAFSKELLPVGGRSGDAREQPKAVSEYLLERMTRCGVTRVCFVIAPGKSDIMEYYGRGTVTPAEIVYVVQPRTVGLCDAIFRAHPVIPPGDDVVIGLPDTIWFPEDALACLPADRLAFLLFPVAHPELFDTVLTDSGGRVLGIQVKPAVPVTHWIWGAFRMPGRVFHELHGFWRSRPVPDEYVGTLVNAWLQAGGQAVGVRAGTSYLDVGTLSGYRSAMERLQAAEPVTPAFP